MTGFSAVISMIHFSGAAVDQNPANKIILNILNIPQFSPMLDSGKWAPVLLHQAYALSKLIFKKYGHMIFMSM